MVCHHPSGSYIQGFASSLPSRYYPGPMLLTSESKCVLVSLTRYEPLVFNICATENSGGKNLMLVFEVSWSYSIEALKRRHLSKPFINGKKLTLVGTLMLPHCSPPKANLTIVPLDLTVWISWMSRSSTGSSRPWNKLRPQISSGHSKDLSHLKDSKVC